MWRAYEILKRTADLGLWFSDGYLSVKPNVTVGTALRERDSGICLNGDVALVPQGDCDDRSYLFLREVFNG